MKIVCLVMFLVGLVQGGLKLPKSMSQHQYCMGCIATVTELENRLSKRHVTGANKEAKIMEMIEGICAPNNFVSYDYSPPKTVKACNLLIENNEEDLEKAFMKSMKDKKNYVCYEKSEACVGIDITDKKKASKLADVDLTAADGETTKTVNIDPSGSVKFEKDANNGKTLSKKSKRKTEKKSKSKKDKKKEEKNVKKGAKDPLNRINVDINDPSSMDKVMEQIKNIQNEMNNEQKEEL